MLDGPGSWLAWAALAALFAALTAVFAKIGVEDVDPDYATFLRTLVVIVALGLVLFAPGRLRPLGTLSPRSSAFIVLSGLATGASWVCYFRALKLGDVSRVAPIDKLSVVLIAVFGVVFLGETLSVGAWLGIALITIGVALVALG